MPMTHEDEEFNRIEMESRIRQESVRATRDAKAAHHGGRPMTLRECMEAEEPSRPERTWIGLEPEEIRKAKHHMVDGAYHYSFKQGAEWAEARLKERNT